MNRSDSTTGSFLAVLGILLLASGCSVSRCQPGYQELFDELQSLQVEHWQIGFNALAVGCERDLKRIENNIDVVQGLTRGHVDEEGFLLMHTASDPEAREALLEVLREEVETTHRVDIFFYELSFTELRQRGGSG